MVELEEHVLFLLKRLVPAMPRAVIDQLLSANRCWIRFDRGLPAKLSKHIRIYTKPLAITIQTVLIYSEFIQTFF